MGKSRSERSAKSCPKRELPLPDSEAWLLHDDLSIGVVGNGFLAFAAVIIGRLLFEFLDSVLVLFFVKWTEGTSESEKLRGWCHPWR